MLSFGCLTIQHGAFGAGVPTGIPATTVDLMTTEGMKQFEASWKYHDVRIVDATFNAPGPDQKPTGQEVSTYDIEPKAGVAGFDDSSWATIPADSLSLRRANGKVCFNWYRTTLTMPSTVNGFDASGMAAVLDLTVDDYAEVWINGTLSRTLNRPNDNLITGWNRPNRVVLSDGIMPGQRIEVAVFGINGPISAAPENFIWIRHAKVELFPHAHAVAPMPVDAEIVRVDRALDSIVSQGTVVEQIVEGLQFGEGPVWVPATTFESSHLLFSDPNANRIYRWSPADGLQVFLEQSGYDGDDVSRYHQPGSNGLALDPMGRLTINQHGNRRIVRLDSQGRTDVLADRILGKRLNSPNDLVYRSDGTLFFTDPPFGLPSVYDDPMRELDDFGVYCLKNGSLKLISSDLRGPNGIAFSPDERLLYVTNWDSDRKIIMRYQVGEDGSLSNGVVFFDMTSAPGEEALDGLKVDAGGNLYCSGPGGVWIISPLGKHLGMIKTPQLAANLAWGDEDRRTLYLTARSAVYRLRLLVSGARAIDFSRNN